MQLFEAVPNVSEGRSVEVLERLAGAARSVPGAHLLDWSADPDHHRSVFTLAGAPAPLEAAIVALAAEAVAGVDLRRHRGVHPRVGALDVVPLVPLGATMAEAAEVARRVGERVGASLGVPVFLYEAAATRPERASLAALRRGGLAGLAERLASAEWGPDFGPPRPHPTAGATAVGARDFLIAFNVVLASSDVSPARAIARRLRESAGGLPGVRALGLYLATRDRAQVSMNLVDFRRTGLAAALGAVRREAADLGTAVESCEIVGLVPEAALPGAEGDELLAAVLGPERVLENRLRRHGLI